MDSYILGNGNGMEVVVWTYGATLVEVRVPGRGGRQENVVHRLPTLADYEDRATNAYVGATVGRFCRNVAHGRFALDGTWHLLDRNEGQHHLHGGTYGFDRLVWTATTSRTEEHVSLMLTVNSPRGDQGYPGGLHAETVYRLGRKPVLTIGFRATTTAPTIVGLTNHAFWNLSGTDTQRAVDGQHVLVNAGRVLEFAEEQIPVPGPPAPVAGTALDLTSGESIGGVRLDNFYVLDDPASCAADLHDPSSGRHLRITTDQKGMGVYTGDGLAPSRAGLCLQPGPWPDAPNRPDFPSARLDPGHTYTSTTRYAFSVR
ncbi:aldose epimerase family protein [Streptomyces sp. SLBN-115]|uniref:aldose epimerase family protein n=1 Tax=Streptomyces sp. SLBN-115 TaxID=2768453 RepID=UPI001F28C224|nr:aldose epimerase family protein [Streptomyces sp. SLBN-115]